MLKKSEQAVLDAAAKMEVAFTPTMIGKAMGYEHAQASSRVAPALKELVRLGLMSKKKVAHNVVTYSLAKPSN